jgi:hypothetical protein
MNHVPSFTISFLLFPCWLPGYTGFFVESRQTGNVYKNVKRKIERGIAFPTCLSVNNTVCHFSPLATDDTVLQENDMVKMYCLASTFFCLAYFYFYFFRDN